MRDAMPIIGPVEEQKRSNVRDAGIQTQVFDYQEVIN